MAVKLKRTPTAKKKATQVVSPLPEAIDGGEWDIKPTTHRRDGTTTLRIGGGGKLQIPLGGGEVERAIRIQEQVHAAITPRDPEAWDGVDPFVLDLCEDRRVRHAMGIQGFQRQLNNLDQLAPDLSIEWDRLKLDYEQANKSRDKTGKSLKVIPPRAIVAARVMAAVETGLQSSEYGHAVSLDEEAAKLGYHLGRQFQGDQIRPFEEAKLAAELLCEMFGTPGDPVTEDEPPPLLMPSFTSEGMKGRSFLEELQKIKDQEQRKQQGQPPLTGDKTEEKFWGEMTIVEKPRPLRLNGKLLGGSKKIPDTRGRTLRRVSRLAHDGRVFRNKHYVKRRGGAVLIDCSGSMNLDEDQVESIVIALPASVIATYNAPQHDGRGQLWIVARNGKRAKKDDLSPPWKHNIIDVPALKWLAEQKGPRYWVSDGIVTERGGLHTPRVVALCRLLQKAGNIIRVPSVTAVLEHEGWERVS